MTEEQVELQNIVRLDEITNLIQGEYVCEYVGDDCNCLERATYFVSDSVSFFCDKHKDSVCFSN